MEGGYLDHNPAWRTYKYAGQKKEKKIADDETVKKLIQALETTDDVVTADVIRKTLEIVVGYTMDDI